MSGIRSWHWALALVLAIVLHLAAYLGLVSGAATTPAFRGGGSFGATGNQAAPAEGLLVGLAPPSAAPANDQTASEPKITAAPRTETPSPAEPRLPENPRAQAEPSATVESPPAPRLPDPLPSEPLPPESLPPEPAPADVVEAVPAPEPEAPKAEPEVTEVKKAEETPPKEESPLPEPVVAEVQPPEEPAKIAAVPPVPSRKPTPPPVPRPELGLLEERLPLEGPEPKASPQDQAASTASTASSAAPVTKAVGGEISSLRHVDGEGAVGTASLNSEGQVPTLNYKDQVLLWVKRHGSYPRESHRFRQEGTVLLHFVVSRSGEILYYNIRKSSGFYLLDQAVKKMMERSSPVPPIPAQISQDEIEFTVPVEFLRNLG
ncbi:energy transducer TonB [Pelagibius sp. Alg239-R121]|uniref:energy transducer TonB n=1 Tax=Pelagibius sp. Alg239-R121 TaxID=2993448 RepID=UPI0024A7086C|nr:TonB family protein [Pelagibius sp. Alg239-R121]